MFPFSVVERDIRKNKDREKRWFLLICFYLFFWCFFEHFLQRIRRQKCSVFSAKMMALVITHTYIYIYDMRAHKTHFKFFIYMLLWLNRRIKGWIKLARDVFTKKKSYYSRYFSKNADNNNCCFLFRFWWNAIFAKNNWNWEIELVYIFWL